MNIGCNNSKQEVRRACWTSARSDVVAFCGCSAIRIRVGLSLVAKRLSASPALVSERPDALLTHASGFTLGLLVSRWLLDCHKSHTPFTTCIILVTV